VQWLKQGVSSVIRPLRAFWADRGRRRTAMWVIGALGVAVLLFGGYTFIDAQRDYSDLSKKIDKYPHDLTQANVDVYELQLLGLWRRDRDKVEATRGKGVMLLGIGLTGLGLAYLLMPGVEPPTHEDPSFVKDEIASGPPNENAA
jgi:hypothetical protein